MYVLIPLYFTLRKHFIFRIELIIPFLHHCIPVNLWAQRGELVGR